VNLFNEPERAIREFIRVAKKDDIIAWGDEGFSPNLPDSWRVFLKLDQPYRRNL
jgi:hypothetical protein